MKEARPTPEQTIPREELIRKRAYELYEQHKMQQGSDLDDWLEAEKEILEAEATEEVAA